MPECTRELVGVQIFGFDLTLSTAASVRCMRLTLVLGNLLGIRDESHTPNALTDRLYLLRSDNIASCVLGCKRKTWFSEASGHLPEERSNSASGKFASPDACRCIVRQIGALEVKVLLHLSCLRCWACAFLHDSLFSIHPNTLARAISNNSRRLQIGALALGPISMRQTCHDGILRCSYRGQRQSQAVSVLWQRAKNAMVCQSGSIRMLQSVFAQRHSISRPACVLVSSSCTILHRPPELTSLPSTNCPPLPNTGATSELCCRDRSQWMIVKTDLLAL